MRVLLVALIALSLGFAGCTGNVGEAGDENSGGTSESPGASDGTSSGETSTDSSSASIYVKDAPTDEFSEIHVVFTKVQVHAAGGDDDEDGSEEEEDESEDDNETAEDDNVTADDNSTIETDSVDDNDTEDDGGDSSWITLFESEEGVDVDLLAASGDAAAFLGEASLDAGKYTQIRIDVSHAYGVSLDGNSTVNITVSSGTLKINHPFDVVEGQESQITVDYDLNKSLKQTGKDGWRLTPVIGSVVVDHVDDESSGEDVDEEGEIDSHDDDAEGAEEEEEEESEEEDESDNSTQSGGNATA